MKKIFAVLNLAEDALEKDAVDAIKALQKQLTDVASTKEVLEKELNDANAKSKENGDLAEASKKQLEEKSTLLENLQKELEEKSANLAEALKKLESLNTDQKSTVEELKIKALEILRQYPDKKEIFATSDGNFFLNKSDCDNHKRISKCESYEFKA